MNFEVKTSTALRQAADWLEQNRDNHIIGEFAINKQGTVVHPASDEAECFCALGRLVREAKMSESESHWRAAEELLKGLSKRYDEVYTVNDDNTSGDIRTFKHEEFGEIEFELANSEVLSLLRELADEAEAKGE